VINTVVIIILLAGFGQYDPTQYNTHYLDEVWRISFAVGLVPILLAVTYRCAAELLVTLSELSTARWLLLCASLSFAFAHHYQ
jgi:hypothetical protein